MSLKFAVQVVKPPLLTCMSKRFMCTGNYEGKHYNCKLLIVGGGTGGCAVAAKFARKMENAKCEIFVVEPNEIHYCKPSFTLIGAGAEKIRNAMKPTIAVLPENVTWIKDSVERFCPSLSCILTRNEKIIEYEYMVIATGIELDFEKIKSLKAGLDLHENVATITSPDYVEKMFGYLSRFASGNVLLTHPAGKVNCISSKICFLVEDFLRKHDKLCDSRIFYVTAQSNMFHVDKYAKVITRLAQRKGIEVCFSQNLVEIIPEHRIAIFEDTNNREERNCMKYDLLHVIPPMRPIEALRKCPELSTADGYVDVHTATLQHNKYPNIFAIGDCSSLPTTKSASATAIQAIVLHKNLTSAMAGKPLKANYNGYAACPIVTGYGKCLLAEYDYALNPKESFPFRQNHESKFIYYLMKDVMPYVYWHLYLTGKYPDTTKFSKLFSWYKSKK